MEERREFLSEVLQELPETSHAFAYGSGVFNQPGLYAKTATQKAVLDYFLVVKNATKWHNENIAANPHHYAGLAAWGGTAIREIAHRVGVGVHFNTLVPWRNKIIKYGVIGLDDAVRDLMTWNALYFAGRLQKPVLTLKCDPLVEQALEHNKRAAVATSLLMLPPRFRREQLHHTVCGLSYQGDVRMGLAEDNAKVSRIASGSASQLANMYSDDFLLREFRNVHLETASDSAFLRSADKTHNMALLSTLPAMVVLQLAKRLGLRAIARQCEQHAILQPGATLAQGLAATAGCPVTHNLPGEIRHEVAHAAVNSRYPVELLSTAVGAIVNRSSRRQALSGFLTAGPWKAAAYVSSKVQKSLTSLTSRLQVQ